MPSPALTDNQIAEYLRFACHLGEVAGKVILPHFRAALDVTNKVAGSGFFDPVTIADRDAEHAMREEIARAYPAHGIYGEEHGRRHGSDHFTWVLDPIDGTRAFILGLLHWGTLIALNDGERPIVGVMHQPYTGETFVGSRLGAEFRHAGKTRVLRARKCARIEDAVVSATDPAMFRPGPEREVFREIARIARLTRYGGDCYAYCMLASGLIDLVIESQNQAYDLQALIPIVEAAGGVMTSWSGASPQNGGQSVASGNPELHEKALKILGRGIQ
ncbi:MAG TPA: histidinol-phosphatase [Candidatus Binataceae bacterium]|nr:histidinol-phosphatase [Candidatus Binataceae bacterium]